MNAEISNLARELRLDMARRHRENAENWAKLAEGAAAGPVKRACLDFAAKNLDWAKQDEAKAKSV